MTEDDLGYINHLDTRSSYSEGKRACECYCYAYAKEYGVNVTIARLAQTFGPGVAGEDNRVSIQFAKARCKTKISFCIQRASLYRISVTSPMP